MHPDTPGSPPVNETLPYHPSRPVCDGEASPDTEDYGKRESTTLSGFGRGKYSSQDPTLERLPSSVQREEMFYPQTTPVRLFVWNPGGVPLPLTRGYRIVPHESPGLRGTVKGTFLPGPSYVSGECVLGKGPDLRRLPILFVSLRNHRPP